MTQPDYEYHSLLASTWDLLRGDTSTWPDRFFYLDIVKTYGQPVLDVGCGTGRLLLDYMQQGIEIDGVDNSPEMLALCRQKGNNLNLQPTLFQQEMATLALPRRYRTIIVPSSSFQLVLQPEQTKQTIQRFYEHLQPGGVLVMPFMIIWEAGDPLQTDWRLIAEVIKPEDGDTVRRWGRTRYEPEIQLEHTEDRYEIVRNDEIIFTENHQRSPATRWYTQAETRVLYEEAGFTNIQFFSQFTQMPASPTDTIFSVLGQKP